VKLAYVCVRYGAGILGGAEQACRALAEHMAAEPGVSVEVFTTCATDVNWADVLPPGTTVEGGVTVHRRASVSGRDPGFERFSATAMADPRHQTEATQRRWLDLQGPVCPDVVEGAASSDADLVAATPYLYWPAVHATARLGRRMVLHPAAHDEAPIRLPLFAHMFTSAGGLAYNTEAERRVVERLFPAVTMTPQIVVGIGVDADAGAGADPSAFRESSGIGDRPYLLCLGRVDDGKGVLLLSRLFAAYKRRRPGPLALVFAGPVVHRPPEHPDVVVTGPLSEVDKWSALAGTEVLVNPSANESFSIVVLEAWALRRATLVNAWCNATVEHTRRSRGGLTFGTYAGFEIGLDRLLGDPVASLAMGDAGRAYVERLYAWSVVTARYRRWLGHLAAGPVATGPRSTTLIQR